MIFKLEILNITTRTVHKLMHELSTKMSVCIGRLILSIFLVQDIRVCHCKCKDVEEHFFPPFQGFDLQLRSWDNWIHIPEFSFCVCLLRVHAYMVILKKGSNHISSLNFILNSVPCNSFPMVTNHMWPQGQFQPNIAQHILQWFLQMKNYSFWRGDNSIYEIFCRTSSSS